jgi:hypothetical protein
MPRRDSSFAPGRSGLTLSALRQRGAPSLLEPASSRRGGDGVDVVNASAALKDAHRKLAELKYLTPKSFRTGASLMILSAQAPRRLRRYDFLVLYCDEVDVMEITLEGDRSGTFAHADRKIVTGSTVPTMRPINAFRRSPARIATSGSSCSGG